MKLFPNKFPLLPKLPPPKFPKREPKPPKPPKPPEFPRPEFPKPPKPPNSMLVSGQLADAVTLPKDRRERIMPVINVKLSIFLIFLKIFILASF